jgi:site-specific DNA recombinase
MPGRKGQLSSGITKGNTDAAIAPSIRCAIYTRKSTNENLDSDFNSLDAQRESGEHFIQSHVRENWIALPERYDDGAYSGATMDRPALQRLIADIKAGQIDCVLVYKIDRLSRSLSDFTRMMEFFKEHDVTMVSVTQAFNANTSSGTLMTNLLMTFASYEREVIAERIRDKVAASKKRGKYMGGVPPLGYDVDRERKRIIINADEAALVRFIFRRYLQLRSPVALTKELNGKGLTTKSWVTKKGVRRKGRPWNKSHIYRLLKNPIYIGQVKHREQVYPGEHEAIIEQSLWDDVQRSLSAEGKNGNGGGRYSKTPALLKGLLVCGHCKTPMGITYTKKDGKKYRYYLCQRANKSGYDDCPIRSVPAGDIENLIMMQVRKILNTPEIAAETFRLVAKREKIMRERLDGRAVELKNELDTLRSADERLQNSTTKSVHLIADELATIESKIERLSRELASIEVERDFYEGHSLSEKDLSNELQRLTGLWDELFPGERNRIIRLLLDEVVLTEHGVDIALLVDHVEGLSLEMKGEASHERWH